LLFSYSSKFGNKKILDNFKITKRKSINEKKKKKKKKRKREVKQYKESLGKYHILYLDFSLNIEYCKTIYKYLNKLELKIKKNDLYEIFPNSKIKSINGDDLNDYFMALLEES